MASPFAKATLAAAATHDAIMAEPFEVRPMKLAGDVNAPTVVDPDRAILTIAATFGEYAARVLSGPFHQPGVQPERAGHASARPYISIRLSQLPYRPRKGDQVFQVDTSALFRIAEVLPSTPGFVRCDLNRI
jgi:hypothetical protein